MATKEINTQTIVGNRNITNMGSIAGSCIITETVINIFPHQILQINQLNNINMANKYHLSSGISTILYQMQPEDLQRFLDESVAEIKLQAFLNRFENVLIGVKDIAHIHSVNPRTVTNYIKDGLIVPEMRISENDHYRFRLSYALTLNFRELQKQLRVQKHKNNSYK